MGTKIVNSLDELKAELQKVLVSRGFIDFCKECPVTKRCCEFMSPNCSYVQNKCDCGDDKKLECYFYICPVLNEKNKEVSNWLQRINSSIKWPNELKFPLEIEDFKEKENEPST